MNQPSILTRFGQVISSFRANGLAIHGVENAFSMKDGIEEWAERINPEMPRY